MITATIGLALPAHAQTDTCNVIASSCTTDTIPSNSSGKWIKYQIENAAWDDSTFAIYDADTGSSCAKAT